MSLITEILDRLTGIAMVREKLGETGRKVLWIPACAGRGSAEAGRADCERICGGVVRGLTR